VYTYKTVGSRHTQCHYSKKDWTWKINNRRASCFMLSRTTRRNLRDEADRCRLETQRCTYHMLVWPRLQVSAGSPLQCSMAHHHISSTIRYTDLIAEKTCDSYLGLSLSLLKLSRKFSNSTKSNNVGLKFYMQSIFKIGTLQLSFYYT